jgi:hypothetical protein
MRAYLEQFLYVAAVCALSFPYEIFINGTVGGAYGSGLDISDTVGVQ